MKTRWTTILQNQVVALVLMTLFLVPVLFAAPQAQRADQLVVYGFLGLILTVAWALRAQGGITLEKVKTFVTSGPNLPIILFVAWNGLAALRSAEPAYSRWSMIQLVCGVVLYAVVVYQFRQKEQVRALLSGLVVMGIVAVLAALALNRSEMGEFTGSFKDRQLFGGFLMLVLPVAMGVAAGTRNKVWKMVAQLAVILVAGALLMTKCRSSWLGAGVAVSTFALLGATFAWKTKTLQSRKHELVLAPILGLVVVALFITFSGKSEAVAKRLGTMSSLAVAQKDDSVVDRTQSLWTVGQKVINAAPVTGFGPGTYPLVQARYNPDARPESLIRAWGPSLFDNPHNLYIQIAAETGWVGLGLYLAVLGSFLFCGVRALGKMDAGLRKYVLVGCIAAVVGQSVDAVANPGYVFAEVTTFFWVVLAIGMCAAGLAQRMPVEAEAQSESAVPSFVARGVRTATIGCVALGVGAMLWSFHTATAAAAGAPPFPGPGGGGGNGGGGTPTYSGLLTAIDVDVLEDSVPPPAAFNLNNFQVYCNRALEFHVFAVADIPTQSANVTFEKKAFKFKLEGIKGKVFFTKAFNNPRFYFVPAKASCGRSGIIRVFYKTKQPKETFETQIAVSVLGDAPPNLGF